MFNSTGGLSSGSTTQFNKRLVKQLRLLTDSLILPNNTVLCIIGTKADQKLGKPFRNLQQFLQFVKMTKFQHY